MTDTATAPQGAKEDRAIVPVPVHANVIEAYEAMIERIPDAGQDGIESILIQLASAKDVGSLDAPWRAGGLGAYIGRPLRITGARKMPSEFEGGLPWFFILDGACLDTGETFAITTGATSVLAQITQAYNLGALPGQFDVIPRQAKRPTEGGFYPQHLDVMRTTMRPVTPAADGA